MKELIAETRFDSVPAGFKTAKQWAKELNMHLRGTQLALQSLLCEGKVEMQNFRCIGGRASVPHYREK